MQGRSSLPWLMTALMIFGSWVIPASAGPYVETQKSHSWFSFNRPAQKNPADQLAHADRLFAEGALKKAGRAYQALVMTWPGSPEAVPAQLRYARALDARGKSEKAFDAYQALLESNAGGFPYDDVLQRQFDIAQETMKRRRGRILLFGGFQAPERAVPMFEKVVKNGPRSPVAAEAQYLIGWAYEISDQLELAVVSYMTAQHRYPETEFAEKASFGRARTLYRLSEENPNDEEALEQAWAGVVLFLNRYPKSEELEVAKAYRDTLLSRRARVAYDKAVFYDRKARKPTAALQAYRSFVKLFPGSEWVDVAQSRIDQLAAHVENTQ